MNPTDTGIEAEKAAMLAIVDVHLPKLASGAASGGGARARCGFGPADHRGSGTGGSSISLSQTSGFVGGRLPWRGRKCRRQLQLPLAQRQQTDEGPSESGVERGCQNQRQYF